MDSANANHFILVSQSKIIPEGDTIWLERDEALSLDEILALDGSCSSAYAQTALAGTQRLVKRLEGRFVFGIPELGDTLDVLAAMRRTMNLLMDVVEEPEKVDASCGRLLEIWYSLHGRLSSLIDPCNQGCYSMVMRLLSGKPAHCATCDFAAMIGPELFARWALPQIRREIEHFRGRVIYHLDGPGELSHLDALQILPGVGKPSPLHYMDALKQVQAAAKNLHLDLPPEEVKPALENLFARGLYINVWCRTEREARELLKNVERWSIDRG